MSKSPKQEFVEYVRSLGLEADESETYEVLEGRVAKHFTTEDTPTQIEPMLAEDVTENPEPYWEDKDWICEEKLDGVRMLMHFHRGRIRFTTRGKDPKTLLYNEKTDNYPQYHDRYSEALEGTILDGEMIAGEGDKRPPIAAIQAINGALPEQALETQKKFGWARFVVFDIIRFGREDVTELSWQARRKKLETVCKSLRLQVSEVVKEGKKAFYEEVVRRKGEGVMLKHIYSKYRPNSRVDCWLKVKRYDDVEAVITGWSPGAGRIEGKVGACTVSIDGKVVGAFGNLTDELREQMTASDGSLKKEYYGKRVLVRYQPPLRGLMRHCRLVKFIEEV